MRGGFVDERDKALEAFGATAAQIKQAKGQRTDKDFEVWRKFQLSECQQDMVSNQWRGSNECVYGRSYRT